MSLDLTLSTRPPSRGLGPKSLYITPTANIRVGIKQYGQGITTTGLLSFGIKASAVGLIRLGIAAPTIADPTNPLAVHMGQGAVLLGWQHATPTLVQYYEIFASGSLNGVYTPYQRSRFTAMRGLVNNVPLGINAFFRIRAVGVNGAVSNLVQVKLGKLARISAGFKVRGIAGSRIPINSTFTTIDPSTGLAIAIRNTQGLITI